MNTHYLVYKLLYYFNNAITSYINFVDYNNIFVMDTLI